MSGPSPVVTHVGEDSIPGSCPVFSPVWLCDLPFPCHSIPGTFPISLDCRFPGLLQTASQAPWPLPPAPPFTLTQKPKWTPTQTATRNPILTCTGDLWRYVGPREELSCPSLLVYKGPPPASRSAPQKPLDLTPRSSTAARSLCQSQYWWALTLYQCTPGWHCQSL